MVKYQKHNSINLDCMKNNIFLDQAWQRWNDCLLGDDVNSIFQQIVSIIWDTAIFRIIVEVRKSRFKSNPIETQYYTLLYEFVDRNYFNAQVSSIRRLIDRTSLQGKQGVYSIGALISDIKKYRSELTREKYFKLRGLPYDYESIKQKELEQEKNNLKFEIKNEFYFGEPEFDWENILQNHIIFDRLSMKNADERNPDDLISEQFINKLSEKLEECKKIKNFVDKFIAHSATVESRLETLPDFSITYGQLWETQKTLYLLANLLSISLFGTELIVLPLSIPPSLESLDEYVFVQEDSLIQKTYAEYQNETEKWRIEDTEKMWNWIKLVS